jgi:hypothetical protein
MAHDLPFMFARRAAAAKQNGRRPGVLAVSEECRYRSTGELTAIRSMTRKADEARIRQEMAAAIAAYTGPVSTPEQKCIGWPEQKYISNASRKALETGVFCSGIRLGSDYLPAYPSKHGVSGACSD